MGSSFPPIGTTQRCDVFVFAARSTSTAENITHFPLAEICGSLTRFIRCRSSNVIGRFPDEAAVFCAKPTPPKTNPTNNPAINLIAPV
jgi:hypothetical protein